MTGVGAQPALKCMFIIYVIFLALLGGVDVCGKIVRDVIKGWRDRGVSQNRCKP